MCVHLYYRNTQTHMNVYIDTLTYIRTYVYMCACVCMCISRETETETRHQRQRRNNKETKEILLKPKPANYSDVA